MSVLRLFLLGVLLLSLHVDGIAGGASAATSQATPILVPNKEVLRKLASLKENEAIILGRAKVLGDFNAVARKFELHETGPLGRDYSIKMVWAADRKRALFVGANQGRPHRLNDVWEFDLGAMAWVLRYAPDNPRAYAGTGLGKDWSDVRFENGVLSTYRSGPALIGHTWWGITYDPFRRRLLFMNDWSTNVRAATRQVGGDPADLYPGPPLWSFDPERKTWEMMKTAEPYPRIPAGGMLEFIPELGGAIWHANHWQMHATWLYHPGSNRWEKLLPNQSLPRKNFEIQSPKPEQVAYYDPTLKIVVVQRYDDTFHFDVKTRQWEKVSSRPERADEWPNGHDAFAPIYFDPASGHGLLVDFRTNALWAYSPKGKQWAKLSPRGDPMPTGKKRLAYIDHEYRVFVIIDGIVVWAYRYSSE